MSNDNEPTIGRLVADASRDISALIQSEIRLAKSEIRVSAKAGGIGAALLAIAAFFGLLIIILLSFAFAYFLTMTGLHEAWAFLIVAGVYVLLAALESTRNGFRRFDCLFRCPDFFEFQDADKDEQGGKQHVDAGHDEERPGFVQPGHREEVRERERQQDDDEQAEEGRDCE